MSKDNWNYSAYYNHQPFSIGFEIVAPPPLTVEEEKIRAEEEKKERLFLESPEGKFKTALRYSDSIEEFFYSHRGFVLTTQYEDLSYTEFKIYRDEIKKYHQKLDELEQKALKLYSEGNLIDAAEILNQADKFYPEYEKQKTNERF
jgi:hypothetical protein